MNSTFDPAGQALTFVVPGDLVSTNAEVLQSEISDLLKSANDPSKKWNTFKLDLSAATMIDSVGLGLVVALLKKGQKLNYKMQVLYTCQNVYRSFVFTRLDKHVELVKT